MTFHLEITTPEKTIYKEDVEEIIVPTTSGEITILPNHIPLLTRINPGELTIKKSGKNSHFAITGGFLEVSKSGVNILAEYAIRAEDIEISKALEAENKARLAMKEKGDNVNSVMAEANLRRSLLELKIARRHKKVA